MNSLFQVQGKPFFALGGQVNNSSAADAMTMEHCFRTAVRCGMNSIAAPVYWETLEPEEGIFHFSQVDMLMDGARRHELKLILLWFGTWKNGNSHYIPAWMKRDHKRFIHVRSADGTPVSCISALCQESLMADCQAFQRLCAHIREKNADGTVIGVQVENEPGIIGCARDHGTLAEEIFAKNIPKNIATYAGVGGTWSQVFGFDADEMFTGYYTAKYIDEVAMCGKKELQLPMYINVWLGEMHSRIPGTDYPSGGAVSKLLPMYQTVTEHIDAISPDIYLQDVQTVAKLHEDYSRQSCYHIPELIPTGLSGTNAIRAVVEQHLTGIHYFLLDLFCDPEGNLTPRFAEAVNAQHIVKNMLPLIEKYGKNDASVAEDMSRENSLSKSEQVSKADVPQRLYAVGQYEGQSEQYFDFGPFTGSTRFLKNMGDMMALPTSTTMDNRHFASPENAPRGKGIICYEGDGVFYLAGEGYRLMLYPKTDVTVANNAVHSGDFLNQRSQAFISVEEGHFDENGTFVADRRRNGDEADYGFWVTEDIGVLRVVMDTEFV